MKQIIEYVELLSNSNFMAQSQNLWDLGFLT